METSRSRASRGRVRLSPSGLPATVPGRRTPPPPRQETLAGAQIPPLPAEGSETVLVIDDDENAREILARGLAKEGFRVLRASSGEEGLSVARELRPDVITLDILMPGMDGWAVLKTLKSDPKVAEIPVVLITMVDGRDMGKTPGGCGLPAEAHRSRAAVGRPAQVQVHDAAVPRAPGRGRPGDAGADAAYALGCRLDGAGGGERPGRADDDPAEPARPGPPRPHDAGDGRLRVPRAAPRERRNGAAFRSWS